MKKKRAKKRLDSTDISVFLTRDSDGDYSIFEKEPYFDYECDFWKGKGGLFFNLEEAEAKRYFRLNRHLLKGNKGITGGMLHLEFKKFRNKKQKRSGSIFNKPL